MPRQCSARWRFLLAAAALAGASGSLAAQGGVAGSISGAVVDAESMEPLREVHVTIRPGQGEAAALRHLLTDSLGRYRADALPAGVYAVRAERVGYRAGEILVRIEGQAQARLSVGLQVAAIAMEPILVTSAPTTSFATRAASGAERDSIRVRAERLRQGRFLAADAVLVTPVDVEEAVSLGEADVLRALQRRTGVGTRDDYSAELWVRGAAWDLTSVQFDGVPLFNPMHAVGAFSILNTDAVAEAAFHPGVQPLQAFSGAAGLLDVRSRSGLSADGPRHSGELSLTSARASTAGQTPRGTAGWMVSARRTYLDLLTTLPYSASDVTARADWRFGDDGRVEASGLEAVDDLRGTIPGMVEVQRARWGSRAGRLTVDVPARGGRLRATAGGSLFRSGAVEVTGDPSPGCVCADRETAYRAPTVDGSVRYRFAEAVWTRARGPAVRSAAGVRLASQRASFSTRGRWPFRPDSVPVFSAASGLDYASAWVEHRRPLLGRAELELGLRGDARLASMRRIRWSPRVAARTTLAPRLTASAGWARTFQYAWSLRPEGPDVDRIALSETFWVIAGDSTPPVRAEVGTVGVEYGVDGGFVLSATGFMRHAAGIASPVSEPGWLPGRAPFVPAGQAARGAEVSLRRISGSWTGGIAYSYLHASNEVDGVATPSATERRHLGNLSLFARLPWNLRAGGTFSLASGEPLTRYSWTYRCAEVACGHGAPLASGSAVARSPGYRSLDLQAGWSRAVGAGQIDIHLQLRNVLGLDNRAAYRETIAECTRAPCDWGMDGADPNLALEDVTLPGLGFVPLLSVRFTY